MEKVQEIQARINGLTKNTEQSKKKIETLRAERAELVVNSNGDTAKIDQVIHNLTIQIDNAPAELTLLQSQLADEQQKQKQAEQEQLLEQQQTVATEVEVLSKKFIKVLQQAVTINENLIAAISAEANLRVKTGKQFLTQYCDGSRGSLAALLEKSKMEMDGSHGTMLSPGQEIRMLL